MRMPMTVAMFPLLHNRLPFFNKESYLKKPSLPYKRLPALRKIERNSPFVFNWPVGDSVYVTAKRPYSVEQVNRDPAFAAGDPALARQMQNKEIITRPIDKKDHYIKRCVAIPGDSLQIIDGQIHINGSASKNPKHMQFQYAVRLPGSGINREKLEDWGIDQGDYWGQGYFLDVEQAEKLRSMGNGVVVQKVQHQKEPVKLFPHDPKNFPDWSVDNFGPLWIPAEGATVELNEKNISLYRRVIDVYENNDVEIRGGQMFINGEAANNYTFKQNYYWAMGDNRHNSEDSRMWGFVPHDHIVGRPLFIHIF